MVDFSRLDATAERFWCTLFRYLLGGCKSLQDVSSNPAVLSTPSEGLQGMIGRFCALHTLWGALVASQTVRTCWGAAGCV